jgi:hypothetical protein
MFISLKTTTLAVVSLHFSIPNSLLRLWIQIGQWIVFLVQVPIVFLLFMYILYRLFNMDVLIAHLLFFTSDFEYTDGIYNEYIQ